jgi:hypothetical protein
MIAVDKINEKTGVVLVLDGPGELKESSPTAIFGGPSCVPISDYALWNSS